MVVKREYTVLEHSGVLVGVLRTCAPATPMGAPHALTTAAVRPSLELIDGFASDTARGRRWRSG